MKLFNVKSSQHEVFPLLVGTQLYYGVPPSVALSNMGLRPEVLRLVLSELRELELLTKTDPVDFTPRVRAAIAKRFAVFTATEVAHEQDPKSPPAVLTLVGEYRRLTTGNCAKKPHCKPPAQDEFLLFRRLCQRFNPFAVQKHLPLFFAHENRQLTPDFSLESFQRYLRRNTVPQDRLLRKSDYQTQVPQKRKLV